MGISVAETVDDARAALDLFRDPFKTVVEEPLDNYRLLTKATTSVRSLPRAWSVISIAG